MLSHRDGKKVITCDGCYRVLGDAKWSNEIAGNDGEAGAWTVVDDVAVRWRMSNERVIETCSTTCAIRAEQEYMNQEGQKAEKAEKAEKEKGAA